MAGVASNLSIGQQSGEASSRPLRAERSPGWLAGQAIEMSPPLAAVPNVAGLSCGPSALTYTRYVANHAGRRVVK